MWVTSVVKKGNLKPPKSVIICTAYVNSLILNPIICILQLDKHPKLSSIGCLDPIKHNLKYNLENIY